MSTVLTRTPELNSVADTTLKAAGLWFVVAVIGQWTFLYYFVAFYGCGSVWRSPRPSSPQRSV